MQIVTPFYKREILHRRFFASLRFNKNQNVGKWVDEAMTNFK